jgi:KUP system potassium uptake protein
LAIPTDISIPDTTIVKSAPRSSNFVATLGVVYGGIGTSPLYAVRQSLIDFGDLRELTILGALSLIVWSLALVVTVKYVLIIMRADNRGEGGLLALTALLLRRRGQRGYFLIIAAGLVGAALFYGIAVIAPAVSVLSAVEGLKVATPLFEPYVMPITLSVLIALFVVQRKGAAAVGGFFGPVMLVWFAVLAALGIWGIMRQPGVLRALDPSYGFRLLATTPGAGFIMLGSVFLAVTGAEALYDDMGLFGRKAVRTAWFRLVFPGLLLNYFGQGALLLGNPNALENPFYLLAPEWGLYPLVGLATLATIIASQAAISGAFSVTEHAIQLGYLPRFEVRYTSETEIGQIFVPRINIGLLITIVILVHEFEKSDNFGAAYGIAVSGMMAITTGLAFLFMCSQGWRLTIIVPIFAVFGLADISFFSANLFRITEGGWFAIVAASVVIMVMATWWRGRRVLAAWRSRDALPLHVFVEAIRPELPSRVPGTAIFMARDLARVPETLLIALKHCKVLHERVIIMHVDTQDVSHVPDEQRLKIDELGKGFYTILVSYGFMDEPNIPRALAQCRVSGLRFNLMETSFFLGREKLRLQPRRKGFSRLRDALFILMWNNMPNATEFFRIPLNRAVALEGQIEI